MLGSLSAILASLRYMGLFFLVGIVIGGISGWKIGGWWIRSNELSKITQDYKELSTDFSKYQLDSQKKVDEYVKKISDEFKNNEYLQQKQSELIKDKEYQLFSTRDQMNELRKLLSTIPTISCNLDVAHQRLLDRISQAANRTTVKRPSGDTSSSTSSYLHLTDFTVPASEEFNSR